MKIIGKISTFSQPEQYMLLCYYNKCRAYQTLWRISADIYQTSQTTYVLMVGLTALAMSILTQIFVDDPLIRDINTVVTAVIGFTIGLTKSDSFNYAKLAQKSISISDQFRDMAVKINKNLVASIPEDNAYHSCIDGYTTMEAKENKLSCWALLWAKIYYRNHSKRSLPAILGGTEVIIPSPDNHELEDNIKDLIYSDESISDESISNDIVGRRGVVIPLEERSMISEDAILTKDGCPVVKVEGYQH